MPQRSEKNLYLWNKENLQNSVYAFKGHNDVVKEFVWRIKSDGDPAIGMILFYKEKKSFIINVKLFNGD